MTVLADLIQWMRERKSRSPIGKPGNWLDFEPILEAMEQRILPSSDLFNALPSIKTFQPRLQTTSLLAVEDLEGNWGLSRQITSLEELSNRPSEFTPTGQPTANLGTFTININAGPSLASNPDALAAFNAAADQWEAFISDPITVNIDADLASLDPGVLGQASSVQLFDSYDTIRDQLVLDASDEPDDGIVAALPTSAQVQFNLSGFDIASSGGDPNSLSGTKANFKALEFGIDFDALFGSTDGTITFNSDFDFDFDPSDGIDGNKFDFQAIAAHEIGHALGFVSEVDIVDFYSGFPPFLRPDIAPSTLDAFRFRLDSNNPSTQAEFTSFPREMGAGVEAVTDQIFPWGTTSDTEWRMSTGSSEGDGRQASHWKDNGLTGNFIGILDPTLAPGQTPPISEADLRALDLIGFEIGSPGFNVTSVTPADSAGDVAITTDITVTFSQAVDPTTVTASSFIVNDGSSDIAGTIDVAPDGLSATFDSDTDLLPGTLYTVTVTNAVTDTSGNPLSQEFTSTFTTFEDDTTGPTVTSVTPPDAANNVALSTDITVAFSEAVDPTSVTPSSFSVNDGVSNIGGTITVAVNGLSATFDPDTDLTSDSTYTVTVTSAVTDTSGNSLDQDENPGNGDQNFSSTFMTMGIVDTTPPKVTSVTPPEGANDVALTTDITVTFSEAVDPATVTTSSFTVKNGFLNISGNITVAVDGLSATFDPNGSLAPGTTYTVTVTSAVTDTSGNPLEQDGGNRRNPSQNFSSTFTTGGVSDTTSPTVTAVTPADGATDVAITTDITVTFSEEVDPTTVTATSFTVNDGSSNISGTITVALDGLSATFDPDTNLLTETLYTVTVTSAVTDISGNSLDQGGGTSRNPIPNFSSTFITGTVDNSGPTVTSVVPANSTTDVAITTNITVAFSEPVDLASITNSSFTVNDGSANIAGTIIVALDGLSATFNPEADLTPESTYIVTVTSALTDTSGNPLDQDGNSGNGNQDFSSTFTTGTVDTTGPIVTSVTPANTTNDVAITTSITITFSEPVDPTTVTATSFTVNDGTANIAGNITVGVDGLSATIDPSSNLTLGTTYTVTVTSAVTDTTGNSLDQDGDSGNGNQNFSSTFTTEAVVDTTAPKVTSVTPADNANEVALTTNITVTFSEAVNPATVTDTSFTVNNGSSNITGNITVTGNGLSATFDPDADLLSGTAYTVTVTSAVTDTSGNSLNQGGGNPRNPNPNFSSTFTTGTVDTSGPFVTSVVPANTATGVPITTDITVSFSEPIDPGSVNSTSFSVNDGSSDIPGTITVAGDGLSAIFDPATDLILVETYTITFTNDVADISGNFLDQDGNSGNGNQNFSSTFTTGATATTMHINDLAGEVFQLRGVWAAIVTVTVQDSNGNPVAGATVNGTWSDGFSGTASGVTDSSGQVTFQSGFIRINKSTTTFTVEDVSNGGLTYDPGANLETVITVNLDGSTTTSQGAGSSAGREFLDRDLLDALFASFAEDWNHPSY